MWPVPLAYHNVVGEVAWTIVDGVDRRVDKASPQRELRVVSFWKAVGINLVHLADNPRELLELRRLQLPEQIGQYSLPIREDPPHLPLDE